MLYGLFWSNFKVIKSFLKNRISSVFNNYLVLNLHKISKQSIQSILIKTLNAQTERQMFSTQPQCCLTFSWIELKMLLRCCLIHITFIILRHILYLVYLCSCLGLHLFISYLCDLFFIFSLNFIANNHYNLIRQTYLLFCTFFRISLNIFG